MKFLVVASVLEKYTIELHVIHYLEKFARKSLLLIAKLQVRRLLVIQNSFQGEKFYSHSVVLTVAI